MNEEVIIRAVGHTERYPHDTRITFVFGDDIGDKITVYREGNKLVIGDGEGLVIIPHTGNKIYVKLERLQE